MAAAPPRRSPRPPRPRPRLPRRPPTPTPTPTPTNYDTEEYRRSNAAAQANAIAAYNAGAAGAGVTVAIIDSGIDQTGGEFAGRISPASRDLVSGRGIVDPDGHGTGVAAVLAAARNDTFIEGVAPQATLLVLRGEKEGSCPECSFYDATIAAGIDAAVANRARVINLSLGGSAANAGLLASISRATAAGVVIVIAAGNDSMAQPDDFALAGLDPAVGNGAYLIVGAVGPGNGVASFSNKAGSAQNIYLAALGTDVASLGTLGQQFRYEGTSLAVPVVSGAAALLAGAFPNLSGRQIVDLLLSSTVDLGTPGTDDVFGHGALDIARAFAPRGATSLAGSAVPISTGTNAAVGGALGTGTQFGTALGRAVVLDGYGRAYRVDLGRTLARAARPGLAGALLGQSVAATIGTPAHHLALTIDPGNDPDPSRGLAQRGLGAQVEGGAPRAGLASMMLWRGADLGVGLGLRLDSISGTARASFLAAPDDGLEAATALASTTAVHARQRLGRWTVSAGADSARGQAYSRTLRAVTTSQWRIGVERRLGSARATASFGERDEANGLLGTTLAPAFGLRAARTRTLGLETDVPLGRWTIGAALRHGWTQADFAPGLLAGIDGARSLGWRLDLNRSALFAPGDHFALRLAQPMRVVGGTAHFLVPEDYNYATLTTRYADRAAALAPSGTERDVEAVYGRASPWGRVETHAFYRDQPGHDATARADMGLAITLSAAFR